MASAGHEHTAVDTTYEYETREPAAFQRFVRRLVAPNVPEFLQQPNGGRLRFESVGIDGVHIQVLEAACAVHAAFNAHDAVVVVQLLAGKLRLHTPDGVVDLNHGESHLLPVHDAVTALWDDARVGIVSIDLREVEQVATELNNGRAAVVRLGSGRPALPDAERYWQASVRMINRDVLTNSFAAGNHLLATTLGRWLAGNLLLAWGDNAVGPDDPATSASRRLPPATLRRAVNFIQDRAGDDIGLDDIAAAAGVTSRSLQYSFRRRWNTTPTDYLRSVRLERAHRELQRYDPSDGVTVGDIAARWGFMNAGRFAARYRETYGVTPSEVFRS